MFEEVKVHVGCFQVWEDGQWDVHGWAGEADLGQDG